MRFHTSLTPPIQKNNIRVRANQRQSRGGSLQNRGLSRDNSLRMGGEKTTLQNNAIHTHTQTDLNFRHTRDTNYYNAQFSESEIKVHLKCVAQPSGIVYCCA